MVTGFSSIVVFSFIVPKLPVIGLYFKELSELPPSILLAIIAGIIVSKAYPDNKLEHYYDNLQLEFKNRLQKITVKDSDATIVAKERVRETISEK